jgi:hypothetical protein
MKSIPVYWTDDEKALVKRAIALLPKRVGLSAYLVESAVTRARREIASAGKVG